MRIGVGCAHDDIITYTVTFYSRIREMPSSGGGAYMHTGVRALMTLSISIHFLL